MARSSLFRFLKRNIQKAQILQSGESYTRRDFISGCVALVGLTSTGVAVERAARYGAVNIKGRNNRRKEKIIIVGAGLSGLVASYRLLKGGITTEIYEGATRIGGRIYTKYNFNDEGMFCELGGELIDTGHEEIISLCKELNLGILDFNEADKNLATGFYSQGQLRTEHDFIIGLQPFLREMAKDMMPLMVEGKLTSPTYRQHIGPRAVALDNLSLAQYLHEKRNRIDTWVLDLIQTAYVSEYGLDAEEQSALNLLVMFTSQHTEGDPRLYGDSDECKRVDGGNESLIGRLAEKISGQVVTHLDHKLVKIKERGSQIELFFATSGATQTVKADRVILSLPFTTLREVEGIYALPMTAVKKKAIAEMGYGSNYKLNLGFSSRFWREPQGAVPASRGSLFTDFRSQCFWEMSRMQKGKKGILTAYFGGSEARKLVPDLQNRTLEDLMKFYPSVREHYENKYLMMAWPHVAFAKGSYSAPKRGQYTSLLGSAKESELGGRLIFTGEHCSLANQGFMNGAVETGNWAADAVLGSRQRAVTGISHGE